MKKVDKMSKLKIKSSNKVKIIYLDKKRFILFFFFAFFPFLDHLVLYQTSMLSFFTHALFSFR